MLFLAVIIRLSAIIDFIVTLLFHQKPLLFAGVKLALLVLFASSIASIVLAVKAGIMNFVVKQLSPADDLKAAQRVVAYALITFLLPSFPFSPAIQALALILLETIGISRQYRLTTFKSLVVALIPFAIIAVVVLLLTYLSIGNAGMEKLAGSLLLK